MRASRAGRLTDGGDALLVALGRVPDLDLEHADALGGHGRRLGGQALGLVPPPGDHLGQTITRAAADEIVERPPERLALEVPEGHLEPRAGGLIAHRVQLARPAVDDRLKPRGVLADDEGSEILPDHVLHGPQCVTGELVGRTGLADADESLVSLDTHEIARPRGQGRRGDHERFLVGELEGVHADGGDLHVRASTPGVRHSGPSLRHAPRGRQHATLGLPVRWECRIRCCPCKRAAAWGISSAGRAPGSHPGGQRFDSAMLHHFLSCCPRLPGTAAPAR